MTGEPERHCAYCGRPIVGRLTCLYCNHLPRLDPTYGLLSGQMDERDTEARDESEPV